MTPTPHPENIPRDIAYVINTHLRFDHCGGNRLFSGVPVHVQARDSPTPARSPTTRSENGIDFDGGNVCRARGTTEGQRRVLALAAPTWLTHADGAPKVPSPH